MYLSYYDLNEWPFQISADPKFLWLGEKHQGAMAAMEYMILGNKSFLLLTGDVGTGKTTLINALVNRLSEETIVANVPDPNLDKLDFYNFVANAFGMEKVYSTKAAFLIDFKEFLHQAHANNKKVLIIIDEAQNLTHERLEEIRLLSNIEKQTSKLLNIFFVGQNEFNDILMRTENRPLRQRITINYNLKPLTEKETKLYVLHRLNKAGAQRDIFTHDAIREIYSFSGGYPRLINIICDLTLLSGYVGKIKTINSKIVQECADEHRLPNQKMMEDHVEVPVLDNIKLDPAPRIQPAFLKPPARKTGQAVGYMALVALLLIMGGYIFYNLGWADPMSSLWSVIANRTAPEEKKPTQAVQNSERNDDAIRPLEDLMVESLDASDQIERVASNEDMSEEKTLVTPKVQAIFWSENVTGRLAVINGHVVREGEMVKGFMIKQILPEEVVIKNGRQSRRLAFALKSRQQEFE